MWFTLCVQLIYMLPLKAEIKEAVQERTASMNNDYTPISL